MPFDDFNNDDIRRVRDDSDSDDGLESNDGFDDVLPIERSQTPTQRELQAPGTVRVTGANGRQYDVANRFMDLVQQRREPAWEPRPPAPDALADDSIWGGAPANPNNDRPPAVNDVPDWVLAESFDAASVDEWECRPPGQVEAWLEGIPSEIIEEKVEEEAKQEEEEEDVDIFTMQPFVPGDKVYTLECKHRFKHEQLLHYFVHSSKAACPCCRKDYTQVSFIITARSAQANYRSGH